MAEEAHDRKSGRELVLSRLVELLLIETLRATPGEDTPPGLLRGLADARLAPALRQMHSQLDLDISEVAERVGYASSSTFSTAFSRHVGTAPGRYARAS